MAYYTEGLIFIATFCAFIYFWCKRNYNYWNRHGIPQDNPTPLIGSIKPFLTLESNFGMHLSNLYSNEKYKNEAVIGIYLLNKPGLIIRDLDLIRSILIKDFNKFANRYSAADPHNDALGANNLFFVKNPKWKEIRTKLSPVFTSGKIKQMYPLMLEIADELEKHLSTYTKNKSEKYFIEETKELCALFTTDMIATIAFGIRANSLKDPKAEFRRICRNIFDFDIMRAKDFFVAFFLPKLVSLLKVKLFTTEFSTYVRSAINHVMEEREKCGVKRNDLIDILVTLKNTSNFKFNEIEEKEKYNDFLIAQAALFLTAGFETSSSTMVFALYELAKRSDLQERLRHEIRDALLLENGKISYENINSLEYLGMVVDEILRLYPTLPFLDREYLSIQGEEDFSLKPHYDYKLTHGMPVYLPVYGIQRDPKYWPNPNTFDPERFSTENKKAHDTMAYITFGAGPHNCIGSRIGLLQVKLGLVHFLKNHSVSCCDKTPKEIKFDPKAFLLQNTGGLYLKVTNDQMYENAAK